MLCQLSHHLCVLSLGVLLALSACSGTQPNEAQVVEPLETPVLVETPVSVAHNSSLFLDTDEVGIPPHQPHIVRHRFVKVNLDLLLDEMGEARRVKEVTINLFPDIVYTGVIDDVELDGGGYSWSGTLKDVEYSSLFIVYTAGVFIGHFASPEGVYEVSVVGESDLYRVILIDQQKLPGGGD